MKAKKRYVHGGGRPLTGIYMSAEETAAYEKACELEGVSKSKQGAKLLSAWAKRRLKKESA